MEQRNNFKEQRTANDLLNFHEKFSFTPFSTDLSAKVQQQFLFSQKKANAIKVLPINLAMTSLYETTTESLIIFHSSFYFKFQFHNFC